MIKDERKKLQLIEAFNEEMVLLSVRGGRYLHELFLLLILIFNSGSILTHRYQIRKSRL